MWLHTAFFLQICTPTVFSSSISVGSQASSSDIIFKNVVSDLYLPSSHCKLIPAHILTWRFYIHSPNAPIKSVEFKSDPQFVLFRTNLVCEEQGKCEVEVENECMQSGEMLVQVGIELERERGSSFYVRKRCGGVVAEGLKIAFQPSPASPPLTVIHNGLPTSVSPTSLSVTEQHSHSFLYLSNTHVYGLHMLTISVKDVSIADIRLHGEVREVNFSFLQVKDRFIDNLSEDFVDAVSENEKISLEELANILNGQKPQNSMRIRVDPDIKNSDFPPFFPKNIDNSVESPLKIRVEYECLEPGVTGVSLELRVNNTYNPYEPVQFTWEKACGGFINPYLVLEWAKGRKDILHQGVLNSAMQVVTSDIQSHVMYLTVLDGEQEVTQPRVRSSEMCRVKVGEMTRTVLVPLHSANVTLEYECKSTGDCQVEMVLDMIPPFTPYGRVEVKWTKQCGGPTPGLNVYSARAIEAKASPDIVFNGTYVATGPLFSNGEDVTIALSYARNDPISTSLTASCEREICSPVLPSSPPLTLTTHKSLFTFTIHCHSTGSSLLTLTIHPQPYDPLSLHWLVSCHIWSTSFIGIALISLLCMCGCGGGVFVLRYVVGFDGRRRKPRDHTPLAEPNSVLFATEDGLEEAEDQENA